MRDDSDSHTRSSTGRDDNRQLTDWDQAATGVAADLYAPLPGDDNATRPGMVGSSAPPSPTTSRDDHVPSSSPTNSDRASEREWDQATTPQPQTPSRTQPQTQPRSSSTLGSPSRQSGGGIMQRVQANPLAVVAALSAGGMLVGRMLRNRGQGSQPSRPPRQPSFYPYQATPGYQGDQGYRGHQTSGGYQGTPPYRANHAPRPEQAFEGRHENVPSASTAEGPQGGTSMRARNDTTIIDNEVYNVIKAAAVKLEGLAAYNTYQQDGQANDPIWQQLRQQDEQAARQLLHQIETFAQDGKLRPQ